MADLELSPEELSVLNDASFMKHKNSTLNKITELLQQLKKGLEKSVEGWEGNFPENWTAGKGRIYRGENLYMMPWRAMDYPTCIEKEDLFIFRALLIWGREFSFHFIITGKWLPLFAPEIFRNRDQLATVDWMLSRQASLWDWKFERENYEPLQEVQEPLEKVTASGFLKLSVKLPLTAYQAVPSQGIKAWNSIMGIIFSSTQEALQQKPEVGTA